ncbi:MAG: hypothetical protein P8Y63_09760 [Deltaproteobacteria bacterium]
MNKSICFSSLFIFLFFLILPSASKAETNCDAYLSWLSSTDAAGYMVYYGTSSGGPYNCKIDFGNPGEDPENGRVNAAVTGLSCDETYYLVSTAYDAHGSESGYSKEVIYKNGTTVEPPLARKFIIRFLAE